MASGNLFLRPADVEFVQRQINPLILSLQPAAPLVQVEFVCFSGNGLYKSSAITCLGFFFFFFWRKQTEK